MKIKQTARIPVAGMSPMLCADVASTRHFQSTLHIPDNYPHNRDLSSSQSTTAQGTGFYSLMFKYEFELSVNNYTTNFRSVCGISKVSHPKSSAVAAYQNVILI